MELFDIMEQIKEHGTLVREPVRLRRKKKTKEFKGLKTDYTPEQYAKKMERDKTTWAGVSGKWKHLRKTYKSRAGEKESPWKISLDEWKLLWIRAGFVTMGGISMTVFSRRGKRSGDARVWRIDPNGSWELSNMVVVYQGEVRANGRQIAKEEAEKIA